MIFPLSQMLKFRSATYFFEFWPIATESNSLYSTMVANALIKFSCHRIKPVGIVATYGPVLAKN